MLKSLLFVACPSSRGLFRFPASFVVSSRCFFPCRGSSLPSADASALPFCVKAKRFLVVMASHGLQSASPAAPPATALPGRANEQGTASYAQQFAPVVGPGHFRKLATYNDHAGHLTVSSLGLGTYLGPETDLADHEYEASICKALSVGINVFDAAINYRNMRSERAIGRAIFSAVSSGMIQRNQFVVCTKGGYFTFDVNRPPNPRKWIEDVYIQPGIFSWADFVAGCHCMTPSYILDQLDKSRKNLGLETVDVYYVHNPETQLSEISREEFNARIKKAFSALEEAVSANKITVYGVATWNGFRVSPQSKAHLSLEDLVDAAREVGGAAHHFRVVQVPFNLSLQEAASATTQVINGRSMSLIAASKELGVTVVASASLMQASLAKGLPEDFRRAFSEGGQVPTDAQCALQFVRTTPGIMTALAGMRQVDHVQENARVISFSAISAS
ncbi:hypothetical protein O6H91_20G070000 [Diphasiastrum complanatum]|uniref:Uncharacterized protein n=1 Tax=Diphasiastrum complanatum TaxID=34168 RepID=A0ACC2ARS1_DIPCM|nr:hypothetical protein O6H91_20G070000 [Diphasiastrum complanatum]